MYRHILIEDISSKVVGIPTGFSRLVLVSDPDGTYCCHLSPRELHVATAEYNARERGFSITAPVASDDRRGTFTHYRGEVELVSTPAPAIYPSTILEDADEDRESLDTDDFDTIQAHRRFEGILAKVDAAKLRKDRETASQIAALPAWPTVADCECPTCHQRKLEVKAISDSQEAKLSKRLTALREEWISVEAETGVSWEEVQSLAVEIGRDGQMRIARDAAEVSYCHRDPSDWQVRAEMVSDAVQAARDEKAAEVVELAAQMISEASEELDQPYFVDDVQQLAEEMLAMSLDELDTYDIECREALSAAREAWKRLFPEDGLHGRIVVRWLRHPQTGKYIRPLVTIGFDAFIEKKKAEAGDELAGLRKALDSLRFRLVKGAERKARAGA